jgi:hypothetical protein
MHRRGHPPHPRHGEKWHHDFDSGEGRRYAVAQASSPADCGGVPAASARIADTTATCSRDGRATGDCDIRPGFIYKKVPHITLGSIANNEPPEDERLYDQPFEDKTRLRMAGPFTVETRPERNRRSRHEEQSGADIERAD